MHVVILCGGSGTRMNDYSFPKPLNMIYGKPSIYYTLQKLPVFVKDLHFIVAPHLIDYNFAEIVINLFPEKHCIFHNLSYSTRGAAESAYVGTLDISNDDEPILFMDNDILYNFPDNLFTEPPSSAFLGTSIDTTGSEAFSFLLTDTSGYVTQYKEKVRISNKYCCGIYGFSSIKQFRHAAEKVLHHHTLKEYYLSAVINQLLQECQPVLTIMIESSIHLGSLKEIEGHISTLPVRKMRICFDLDNTLVSYPTIHGDYSSVRPIPRMIDLVRKLKEEGHTIIIHTARRMATHKGNTAGVIADIGYQTFKTLEEFGIPYDELLFGKPIADMYIDDRGINPYRSDMRSLGLFQYIDIHTPINMLGTNKYNQITIKDDKVYKYGPTSFLKGEIFYYKSIPNDKHIYKFFPTFHFSTDNLLVIEHIPSIPYYTLYKNRLLTVQNIAELFEFIDILHSLEGIITIKYTDVQANYITKLQNRFSCIEDYPFDDAPSLQSLCLTRLASYCDSSTNIHITPYIHGDLWFSNILKGFNGRTYVIDMKGQVNGVLTTAGDKLYDYGKLYQSVLGYDTVLYGDVQDESYRIFIQEQFFEHCHRREINMEHLKTVSLSLVMGTFHSIPTHEQKERVWSWIKDRVHHNFL